MSFGVPKHVSLESGEGIYLVGDTYSVLLSSEETAGKLGMVESLVPAQAGPPPHTHHNEDECFILVEGRLMVTAGEDEYEVSPGGVVYIPRGTSHSYRNLSSAEPAKMIAIFTPAGMEEMFREIGRPGIRGQLAPPLDPSDVEAMGSVAKKYGFTFD
ncbi:cupin domain-containing protein [Streptomyces sp. 049-1]|uniref:cupin domain-containing protein n=1 Tax=Streptomyces sp. 049-1 TaxID=2789264 RepID=UPI003981807A